VNLFGKNPLALNANHLRHNRDDQSFSILPYRQWAVHGAIHNYSLDLDSSRAELLFNDLVVSVYALSYADATGFHRNGLRD
jgi:hypothetical protein